ncbi:MAG: hypothetical protein A3F13_00595 [Gammaproteobacteria bacterium RIFCSPHIGHO2_12_FULL_40_19]|nr:MAG: hypothetical protein A3F13_00595 [Gammaproteobacteria bacterium RIFCSPHIGHO2_12_FULL_40_19]
MGVFRSVKNFAKDQVDAPTWLGLQTVSGSITKTVELGKRLFIPKKSTYTETFEEAKERLNLTDEDLQKRISQFKKIQYFFILFTLSTLAYAFFLFFKESFQNTISCLAISAISFSQFFRYNFWIFQIKKRKLGCTFQEWWEHFIKRTS